MTTAQINRLGENFEDGTATSADLDVLLAYRAPFLAATQTVADGVSQALEGLSFELSQRPTKSTISIIEKLKRERTRLSKMQDIGGLRIIVADTIAQDQATERLAHAFATARVIDRRTSADYRAVHVVVVESGCYIEIQLRTPLQNAWAQTSEKLADKYGIDLKHGKGPPALTNVLAEVSSICKRFELQEASVLEELWEINAHQHEIAAARATLRKSFFQGSFLRTSFAGQPLLRVIAHSTWRLHLLRREWRRMRGKTDQFKNEILVLFQKMTT